MHVLKLESNDYLQQLDKLPTSRLRLRFQKALSNAGKRYVLNLVFELLLKNLPNVL